MAASNNQRELQVERQLEERSGEERRILRQVEIVERLGEELERNIRREAGMGISLMEEELQQMKLEIVRTSRRFLRLFREWQELKEMENEADIMRGRIVQLNYILCNRLGMIIYFCIAIECPRPGFLLLYLEHRYIQDYCKSLCPNSIWQVTSHKSRGY